MPLYLNLLEMKVVLLVRNSSKKLAETMESSLQHAHLSCDVYQHTWGTKYVELCSNMGNNSWCHQKSVAKQGTYWELIYLFELIRLFQHGTGHITKSGFVGRGNQYIQLVKILHCKLPTIGKQLPTLQCNVWGLNCRPQRRDSECVTTVPPRSLALSKRN